MRLLIILLLICCATGCKEKNALPAGILKNDKMQEVFWDIIQAESFTTQFIKKDASKNAGTENAKLQQRIFLINKVSKEDFYNSYTYYATHVELMRVLLDSITAKAERAKYAVLYGKPAVVIPARISLIPLQPRAPVPFIPMPIPSLLQVNDTTIAQSFTPQNQIPH